MKNFFLLTLMYISLNAQSFDHQVKLDEGGFWGAGYVVPKYSFFLTIGIAAWEGSESELGAAAWQSIDAGIMSQVVAEVYKVSAGRDRPREDTGPNTWDNNNKSFLSGHVAGMTAVVTPYILQYKDENPWVHVLWALPAWQMGGRVKANAHWQTDVIGGAIVGFASGYWAHHLDYPFTLYFADDHVVFGFSSKF